MTNDLLGETYWRGQKGRGARAPGARRGHAGTRVGFAWAAALLAGACGGGNDDCPPGSMLVGDTCLAADASAGDGGDATLPDGEVFDDGAVDDGAADGGDACVPAEEECNGRDDDCDGETDEGVTTTFYRDADGDMYGVDGMTMQACAAPAGYAAMAGDCDDGCATCFPGGTEVCDGRDNDCDGETDEGVLMTFFLDRDGDGFGVTGMTRMACEPDGDFRATRGGDCDDTVRSVNPSAMEACNGRDDNCDARIDEGFPCVQGAANVACTTTCGTMGRGTCTASCMPAAPMMCTPPAEMCNLSDDDCDGAIDEGVVRLGPTTSISASGTFGLELVGAGAGYAAVWRDSNSALYVQRISASGALVGARVTLLDGAAPATRVNAFAAAYVPPVSAGSDAYVIVTWQQSGDRDVYATRLNAATLATVTAATSLYGETAIFVEMEAAATVNDLLIAYPRTDSIRIVRATSALGTPSMRDLAAVGVSGTSWIALTAPRAARFLLAYTTGGTTPGITLQALDRFGASSGAAAPRTITGGATALSLAAGTAGPTASEVGVAYVSGGRALFQGVSIDDAAVPAWVGASATEIDAGVVTDTRFLTAPDSFQLAFGGGRWLLAYLKSTAAMPSATASRLTLAVSPAGAPLAFTTYSPDAAGAAIDQTDAAVAAIGPHALVGSAFRTGARTIPLACY
jgi:hypothetical protein